MSFFVENVLVFCFLLCFFFYLFRCPFILYFIFEILLLLEDAKVFNYHVTTMKVYYHMKLMVYRLMIKSVTEYRNKLFLRPKYIVRIKTISRFIYLQVAPLTVGANHKNASNTPTQARNSIKQLYKPTYCTLLIQLFLR